MANIFRVYKDSQVTADRIRAENAAARLDNAPERRLYVFGGADGTFPYFASFGSALTYANALTPAPSTSHPVSIVLLSKQNGDPEVITGNDDWYALCLDGIYVSSPYREIFSTTTLPTTLPKGMRVMYVANGVESLWVGNASGVAWPSVGYKELTFLATQTGLSAPDFLGIKNDIGAFGVDYLSVGVYEITGSNFFPPSKTVCSINIGQMELSSGLEYATVISQDANTVIVQTYDQYGGSGLNGVLNNTPITIRVYS